jgi:8-oxo-dGTP pyrophosphatase MutT (NUDIX family)
VADPRVVSLRQNLEGWRPVDERESTSLEALRNLLDERTDDVFREDLSDHHVTASAFVVSERGIILHRHRRLGIWVQPGGHVDPGESPDDAARRETQEETGLAVRHPEAGARLVHVDVHPGPRGHTHYDLRYLLLAAPEEPTPPEGESPDVFWFGLDDALERAEPALRAAIAHLWADGPPHVQGEGDGDIDGPR